MLCFTLTALIQLATNQCEVYNSKIISLGIEPDKTTMVVTCEDKKKERIFIRNLNFFNHSLNSICLDK